jgi:hypothetical protein
MRSSTYYSVDGFQAHTEGDDKYGGPIAWPGIPQSDMPLDRSADAVETKLLKVLTAIDGWCVEHAAEINGVRLGGDVLCAALGESSISYRVIGQVGVQPAKAKQEKRKGAWRGLWPWLWRRRYPSKLSGKDGCWSEDWGRSRSCRRGGDRHVRLPSCRHFGRRPPRQRHRRIRRVSLMTAHSIRLGV